MFINKYTNCGNGRIEHTQMIHNFADPNSGVAADQVDYTYFNVGWGGVRSSNLPYALEPGKNDDDELDYNDPANLDVLPLCYWGGHDNPAATAVPGVKATGTQAEFRELNDAKMKGYTTFADQNLVVQEDYGNTFLSTRGPPCNRADNVTVLSCTDAQVADSGYTRMQLKVAANSGPNCAGHNAGHYKDADNNILAVGLQCDFHDTGFTSMYPEIYTANRCAPWNDVGFFKQGTNEGICVKYIRQWTNTNNQRKTYFTTHHTDVAAAVNQFNTFFDNADNSGELLLELRQCTNLDGAPAGYDPGSTVNAFTFVYGQGGDCGGSTAAAPGRCRRRIGGTEAGRGFRDYSVFTINWYGQAKLQPGDTFSNRGFYFQSKLGSVQTIAQALRQHTNADKIALEEWSPRNVDVYQSGTSIAVVSATSAEGTSTSCGSLSAVCSGKSTPTSGNLPFFYITCGTNTYLGPDPYHFTAFAGFPAHAASGTTLRSYNCHVNGQDLSDRPTWKLLGFFPTSCTPVISNTYDDTICGPKPTSSPSTSPTFAPTTGPTTSPSMSPSTSPSKAPSTSPSVSPSKNPSVSPTTGAPSTSPTKGPSTSPSASPSKSPSVAPTTGAPSISPTAGPSMSPTTAAPSSSPTTSPPTTSPSKRPSRSPVVPTDAPPASFELNVSAQTTFSNVGPLTSETEAAVTASIETQLTNSACSNLDDPNIESCAAEVTGISTVNTDRARYLLSRRLGTALVVDYRLIINIIVQAYETPTNGVAYNSEEALQAVANTVYNEVTADVQQAIQQGTLVEALKASSTEINTLLANAEAQGSFDSFSEVLQDITFTTVVADLLNALGNWYPDWQSSENSCKNDGYEPGYMKIYGTYYESTLEACCQRYFSWDIYNCMGSSAAPINGFYPNWGQMDNKCLNATETSKTLPDYIRQNPDTWMSDDAESCCKRYYHFAEAECISETTGDTVPASGKWYVNHPEEICVRDCAKEDGDLCGGLARSWDQKFDTPKACCENKLNWISPITCEAKSTNQPEVGSGLWYVDWSTEKCVKDCKDSEPDCGGYTKSWYDLHSSVSDCCNRLWWKERSECTK